MRYNLKLSPPKQWRLLMPNWKRKNRNKHIKSVTIIIAVAWFIANQIKNSSKKMYDTNISLYECPDSLSVNLIKSCHILLNDFPNCVKWEKNFRMKYSYLFFSSSNCFVIIDRNKNNSFSRYVQLSKAWIVLYMSVATEKLIYMYIQMNSIILLLSHHLLTQKCSQSQSLRIQ